MTRLVVFAHVADLEEWLAQGWTAAFTPGHPVQRAYGRVTVWRYV